MKLGPSGGDLAWTTLDLGCHHGGYLIDNGLVYGNHERGVVCLDLKTGQKKWFDKGVGKCSVTYADGMLYLFGENNGVVGLAPASPDGFKLTGRFSVQGEGPSWAHPVVIGGRLYLRFGANLYCFDVKAK
jgi:outer membrane protein assembly factor BamB